MDYLERKHIADNWAVRERVAVCVSSNSASQALISRGARLVEAVGGELFMLHVETDRKRTPEAERTLAANLRFAENLRGEIVELRGRDIAKTVAVFVREKRITKVIFGRSAVSGLRKYLYYSAVQGFLREAPAVDVHIVTQEEIR